jgi:FkbM family methyltransferase
MGRAEGLRSSFRTDLLRAVVTLARQLPGKGRWLTPMLPVTRMRIGDSLMELHPYDNTTEFKLWLKRRREPLSLGRLIELAEGRRALFIDIGANCGLYSVTLARRLAPGSRVLAFEPVPQMAARLRHNLELNGVESIVDVHEVALGAEDGEATLAVSLHNIGETSLRLQPKRGYVERVVPLRRLSFLLPDVTRFETFIVKIDIEGMEDVVIADLLAAARRGEAPLPDAILLEVSHRAAWGQDLAATLESAGYRCTFEGEGNALFVTEGRPAAPVVQPVEMVGDEAPFPARGG